MASERTAGTVDAHHHLWRYTPEEFGWIGDAMQPLRRDFTPEDLATETRLAGIDATVVVQARQSLEETRWLLRVADQSELIRGVVGWAPLTDPKIESFLGELRAEVKLRGLRHVIQDEPDENFILRDDFNRGIAAMAGTGLAYDLLIFARHLPASIAFVDRHPDQVFVLDHLAKPAMRAGAAGEEFAFWAAYMRKLAARPNVWCKVSGMVTEADWENWSLDTLRPYLDVAVESFGPSRLMAGSDWPVCLLASGYQRWFDTLRGYFTGFSDGERAQIFGETASAVYRL